MFNSNVEPLIDDPEFFDTYEEKMPIGMKMKSIFYDLQKWENIKIFNLLDAMYILKNVSSSLWGYIS